MAFAWAPELRRCPWSQIDEEAWLLVGMWQDWKKLGLLPFGGTDLALQPAWVVEAFRCCEDQAIELENARDRAEAAELRRQIEAARES